jgi:hypothetical protein
MVSIEINDKKDKPVEDVEMDSSGEAKTRCIRITIRDEAENEIFHKVMVINESNIRIKPFFNLINEL